MTLCPRALLHLLPEFVPTHTGGEENFFLFFFSLFFRSVGTENSRRPLQREIKKKEKKIKAVIQTALVRQRRLVQRIRKRKEQISPPKNIKKEGGGRGGDGGGEKNV